jgi:hypothetical protein
MSSAINPSAESVAGQLYRTPWLKASQFAAYSKCLERSQHVLSQRLSRKLGEQQNRGVKEQHDEDGVAIREAKVEERRSAHRNKLRELIQKSKRGQQDLSVDEKASPFETQVLAVRRGTVVMAKPSSSRSVLSETSSLAMSGARDSLEPCDIESFQSMSMPPLQKKKRQPQVAIFEDEVGLIDIDDGKSDTSSSAAPEEGRAAIGDTSDDDMDTAENPDPRFVAMLVTRWGEMEKSKSLLTNAAAGRASLRKTVLCVASAPPPWR